MYIYVGGGESKSKHSVQPHGRYVHIRMHIDRLSMITRIVWMPTIHNKGLKLQCEWLQYKQPIMLEYQQLLVAKSKA